MDMLKFYKNIWNTAIFSNLSSNVKFCYGSNLSLPTWSLPRKVLVEVAHWKFCQTTVEQKQENIPVGHPVTHTPSSYTPALFLLTVRTSVTTRCQHSWKAVFNWTSLNRSLGMVTRCHQREGGAFRRGSARAMYRRRSWLPSVPSSPPPWTDRHDWKHYLPATWLAGGN